MSPAEQTLIVLAVVAILFFTEVIPLAVTSMGAAITLGLLGIIPTKQVFSGLANSTVVLFAGMFVVGAAMFHTGLAQRIGETVVRKVGTGENRLMAASMIIAAMLSAVCSNTGTTAALLPVILGICAANNTSSSRQLMPLAFGAGLGGTITLVGTPPNIIASAALKEAGFAPFSFFEFAWAGIPLTIVGVLYMVTIGKRFLPKTSVEPLASAAPAKDDTDKQGRAKSGDPKRMLLTALVLTTVVIVMMLNLKRVPLEMAAVSGALILVVTGCVKEQDAYRSIDWVTIFLFAGMMPVASALDKSGAGRMIADFVISLMGDQPSPMLLTIALFMLSCILTQFMSNTASAAVLCPIGLSIAQGMQISPHAVLMAIALGASCAFMTPVGTPPNTLVLGPGKYRFTDYIKAGTGLVLVSLAVVVFILPIVWPF